ncbi:MAG: hypothetical protein ABIJ08_06015 [Nanoarchaeota archaeon]
MFDIKKELSENQIILLLMTNVDYNKEVVKVVKSLSKKKICYVTLNKTAESLMELFKKNNTDIKNIFFIDAISMMIKDMPNETESVAYISSPTALTDLSVRISQALSRNFDYIIFDSITNLYLHEYDEVVAVFVSSLVTRIKDTKTKTIFYALKLKEHEELLKVNSMFVDKTIDLGQIKSK